MPVLMHALTHHPLPPLHLPQELADKMWEQYSLETWEADQEAYRQQKEAQAAAAALAAQQQAAGKGKAAGGGGTLARQNSTGKATSAGTAAVSSAPAPPPKPTEEDLARGVVDPADSRHMVNVTLNQPANDKLAAIVGAYFDKRCTEPALQAQFLKQLAVTCHFRWVVAGVVLEWGGVGLLLRIYAVGLKQLVVTCHVAQQVLHVLRLCPSTCAHMRMAPCDHVLHWPHATRRLNAAPLPLSSC